MSLNLLNSDDTTRLQEHLHSLYGLNLSAWDDHVLIKRKSSLWLCHKSCLDSVKRLDKHSIDTVGVRLFSGERWPYKPRLNFFKFFKDQLKQGFINLDDKNAHAFLHRQTLEDLECHDRGYVGVMNRGYFIGVSLIKDGVMYSQVPKKVSTQLPKQLES